MLDVHSLLQFVLILLYLNLCYHHNRTNIKYLLLVWNMLLLEYPLMMCLDHYTPKQLNACLEHIQ